LRIFGFEIKRPVEEPVYPSFTPPEYDDGALQISTGGTVGQYLDVEGAARTETELVERYRNMALQPECDGAIDDIVNEVIVIRQ